MPHLALSLLDETPAESAGSPHDDSHGGSHDDSHSLLTDGQEHAADKSRSSTGDDDCAGDQLEDDEHEMKSSQGSPSMLDDDTTGKACTPRTQVEAGSGSIQLGASSALTGGDIFDDKAEITAGPDSTAEARVLDNSRAQAAVDALTSSTDGPPAGTPVLDSVLDTERPVVDGAGAAAEKARLRRNASGAALDPGSASAGGLDPAGTDHAGAGVAEGASKLPAVLLRPSISTSIAAGRSKDAVEAALERCGRGVEACKQTLVSLQALVVAKVGGGFEPGFEKGLTQRELQTNGLSFAKAAVGSVKNSLSREQDWDL